MLVLSRKVGEKIIIDNTIEVEVVEIMSLGRVRIGVRAPKDVPVWREEIQIEREQCGE